MHLNFYFQVVHTKQEVTLNVYLDVQQLWRYSIETRNNFYQWLVDELCDQVAGFVLQGENGQANQFTDLILLLVDSLIFNLYSRHKSNDKNKIHNSLYQASGISTDHLVGMGSGKSDGDRFAGSIALNPTGPSEVGAFINAIEKLLKDKEFFKNLQKLLAFNDSDQNKLQLSFFINSLEYIVEKEGISEEGLMVYQQNRKYLDEYLVEMQKMALQEEIDQINKILFSRKLFKIKKLLSIKNETASPREVHFTILRIYFAGYSKKRSNFKRSHFQKINFAGEDIIYSLTKMYILSQTKRDHLFRETESGDALLDFIINYLLLLFYPVFSSFQYLFDQHIYPHSNLKPLDFFQKIDGAVRTYFVPFFDQLPIDLCNFLAQILFAIKTSPNFSDNVSPCFPITTLFINRFLLNPEIKMLSPLGPKIQIENFLSAANLFKDLFYVNAAKNYLQVPNFQDLSEKLRTVFENVIQIMIIYNQQVTTYEFDRTLDVYSYFITDPLLRNDYNFLSVYMNMLKFNPSDEKEVEVDHFDPVHLQKRNRSSSQTITLIDTSEQMNLLRLTGLRIVDEQPNEDSIRKTNILPNYEDYNSKQQQQYNQQQSQPQIPSNNNQQSSQVQAPLVTNLSPQLVIQQASITNIQAQILPQPSITKKIISRDSGTQTVAQLEEKKLVIKVLTQSTQVDESMSRKLTQDQEQVVNLRLQDAVKPLKVQIQQLKEQLMQEQQASINSQDKHEISIIQIKQQNEALIQQKDKQLKELIAQLNQSQKAQLQIQQQLNSQTETIENHEDEVNQLHQKMSKILDEKELLFQQFQTLHETNQTRLGSSAEVFFTESKMTQYKKKQTFPEDDEYEQINQHLQTRQNQVLKIQGDHEIHRRTIQRKM